MELEALTMILLHGSPFVLAGILGGVCAGYMKPGVLRAALLLPIFFLISAVIATVDTVYITSTFTHSEAGPAWAAAGVFLAFLYGGPVGFIVMLLILRRQDRTQRANILKAKDTGN